MKTFKRYSTSVSDLVTYTMTVSAIDLAVGFLVHIDFKRQQFIIWSQSRVNRITVSLANVEANIIFVANYQNTGKLQKTLILCRYNKNYVPVFVFQPELFTTKLEGDTDSLT